MLTNVTSSKFNVFAVANRFIDIATVDFTARGLRSRYVDIDVR